MSVRKKRALVCVSGLALAALAAGVVAFFASPPATEGAQAALTPSDAGAFHRGYDLALRRAGFTGRPLLCVFSDSSDAEAETRLRTTVLEDPRVQDAASGFTAVWLDPSDVPADQHFAVPRSALPLVYVRDLHGRALGILSGDRVSAESLVAMLPSPPPGGFAKSPLWRWLADSAKPIDDLIDAGLYDDARFALDMLAELEPGSEAQQRAETRRASLPE